MVHLVWDLFLVWFYLLIFWWLRLVHDFIVVNYVLFVLRFLDRNLWFFIFDHHCMVPWQAEGSFFQSWNAVIVEHCSVQFLKNLVFIGFEPFKHLIIYFLDVCPRWFFRGFDDFSCFLIHLIVRWFQKDFFKVLTDNLLYLEGQVFLDIVVSLIQNRKGVLGAHSQELYLVREHFELLQVHLFV